MPVPSFTTSRMLICQTRAYAFSSQMTEYFASLMMEFGEHSPLAFNFSTATDIGSPYHNSTLNVDDLLGTIEFKCAKGAAQDILGTHKNEIVDKINKYMSARPYLSDIVATVDETLGTLTLGFKVSGGPVLAAIEPPHTPMFSFPPMAYPKTSTKSDAEDNGARIFDAQKEIGELKVTVEDIHVKLREISGKLASLDRKVT